MKSVNASGPRVKNAPIVAIPNSQSVTLRGGALRDRGHSVVAEPRRCFRSTRTASSRVILKLKPRRSDPAGFRYDDVRDLTAANSRFIAYGYLAPPATVPTSRSPGSSDSGDGDASKPGGASNHGDASASGANKRGDANSDSGASVNDGELYTCRASDRE